MNYDDDFTQETVWEQLRVMAWISFATLAIVASVLGLAL